MRQKCELVRLAFMLRSCIENRLAKDVEKFMGQQIILSTDWKAVWRGRDAVVTYFTETPLNWLRNMIH